MAELDSKKVKALIRLVKRGRITVDEIKDTNYKVEVEKELEN